MTQQQFEEITQWQKVTFGEANSYSKLCHLAGEKPEGELKELLEDLQANNPERRFEWADCFFLLFGAAAADGMTYDDIVSAIQEKFEINKKRKWGKPDKNGVVNHIKQEVVNGY